jgi:hypothetical protein
LRRSAPHLAGVSPEGGGRIVANRGPYSEKRDERKVADTTPKRLWKWKKPGSFHFLHFVTFGAREV